MTEPVVNRRKEPRTPATGEVILNLSDPAPVEVRGVLVDRSTSGFRVSHQYPELRAGMVLHFQNCEIEGEARVMWNRIQDGSVETGFLILG